MLFSSITFLYYFLPIVLLLYAVVPGRAKNPVLLLASLVFYAWGEPGYIVLMLITIAIGYVFGILLEHCSNPAARKGIVAAAAISGLGMLGYFKYTDFFIGSFNHITGLSIPFLRIALPIGISFYTFQMLSYVIDVERGAVKAQHSLPRLALYIAMFPQLIAGPIVRYRDIEQQLESREHGIEKISYGVQRFVIGLGKKVLFANIFGELAGRYTSAGPSEQNVLFAWLYALAVVFQTYFDFSGYSDMAIGLGSMFGFTFPENFDHPFVSRSVTEFWRRWHITLGRWFRDYLYIPMGGSHVKLPRRMLNILVVWLATGLWHGASWKFVLWGLYFAFWLVLEKLVLKKYLDKLPMLGHVYVAMHVLVSFVLFSADTVKEAGRTLSMMAGTAGVPFVSRTSIFLCRDFGLLLIMGAIGATELPVRFVAKCREREIGSKVCNVLEPVFLGAILLLATAFLVNGSFNPFLYFRF